jgi:zona occludens toxin
MAITVFTGTPGSGKSLHATSEIYITLRHRKRNIIANFPLREEMFQNEKNFWTGKKVNLLKKFYYCSNSLLDVRFLVKFAFKYHEPYKENQTLIVIDEAQTIFNCRDYANPDRKLWNKFMQQHRHLGFEILLITQDITSIDKQIRNIVEYEIKHRKVNNFGIGMFLPVQTFICINKWYAGKAKSGLSFFALNKKFIKMYDTYKMFDNTLDLRNELLLPGN